MAITHLIVDNGNYSVTVDNKVVYKLYDLVKQLYAEVPNHTPADCYLRGTISVEHAHPSRVTFLEEEFEDLHITMTGDPYIDNDDSSALASLGSIGDTVGLTVAVAQTKTSISNLCYNNRTMSDASFFQYFTGLSGGGAATQQAFYNCRNLETVIFPAGLTYIGTYCFYYCSKLTSVTLPDTITGIGDYAFSNSGITSIAIPDGVTYIGIQAFAYCLSLADVTIPSSVTEIGPDAFFRTPWYNSFENGMVYINKIAYSYKGSIPSIGATVTIENGTLSIAAKAFYEKEDLGGIEIPNTVTKIGKQAFEDCYRLAEVSIPNGVTTIGDRTFYRCRALASVTLSNTLTSIGSEAFYGCSSLNYISIPDSVTSIGSYAFANAHLTSVVIPSSMTIIERSTFGACTQLTSVTIPNSITEIGQSAFSSCEMLTSVIIPDSVKSIGTDAFRYCSRLTDVTIGTSVTSISPGAFRDCPALVRVTAKMRTPPSSISSTVFPAENNKISLYVPYGCAAAYQDKPVWSGFKEIIELPEE